MNDVVEKLLAIGSVPLVIAGLVVVIVIRKIVMGLMLLGFGLTLGAVAYFASQN